MLHEEFIAQGLDQLVEKWYLIHSSGWQPSRLVSASQLSFQKNYVNNWHRVTGPQKSSEDISQTDFPDR